MTQRIPPAPADETTGAKDRPMLGQVMMQAPTAYKAFIPLINVIFAELQLDPYDRELVVLYAVHLEGGEYQWVQHVHIATTMMGVPQAQVDAIARGDVANPVFSDRHRALLAFTRQVVKEVRVSDEVFDDMAKHYGMRELMETMFTVGVYMLIARISEVARIPPAATSMGVAAVTSALARTPKA